MSGWGGAGPKPTESPFLAWVSCSPLPVASIRFEVDTRDLSKMSAWVADLQRQLPYAASRALNDTARLAAADLNKSTTRYFQRPVAMTQRAYGVSKWSTKTDLSAELNLKPIQASYLATSIRGGVRGQKPSERKIADRYGRLLALKRKLTAGSPVPLTQLAWRPGAGARLNQSGNIPKTSLVAALRGGGRYFQLDQARGRLLPGVYERKGRNEVRSVLSFGRLPTMRAQWPVARIAGESISRNWPVNLNRWVESVTRPPS